MIKRGRPSKGEYLVKTFRLSQNTCDMLTRLSEASGVTRTDILESAIKQFADSYDKGNIDDIVVKR